VPDLGAPGSAGNGFNHFPLPLDKYTNWYRPRASSLTQYQRCAPDEFRPRGFGNLFARPCDGFRMEYEPYAISDGMSNYGPAYFSRLPNPQCEIAITAMMMIAKTARNKADSHGATVDAMQLSQPET
jgi:hypothetical protein